MKIDTSKLVYKILTPDLWNSATGDDVPPMLIDESDGFIHLSSASQLAETLALHFKGQSGLIILSIRVADIAADLRWEPSRGGQLFPHVYGHVPKTAIATRFIIDVAGDGSSNLPTGLV